MEHAQSDCLRNYKRPSVLNLILMEHSQKGDIVEIFGPKHEVITYTIDKIIDEDNNEIDIVRHPRQIVKIPINIELNEYDMIRIKN